MRQSGLRRLVVCGWVVVLGLLGAAFAGDKRLEVTIDYTGEGAVDEGHIVYLRLYDAPDLNPARLVGVRTVAQNHGTVTFTGVEADTVYLMALFDQTGKSIGAAGPAPQSPIAVYGESLEAPTAIQLDATPSLTFAFDDSIRLAAVMPPQEVNPKLADANGIVEIRMYKIKPGMRDAFVKFFEEKTLKPQSDVGMRILGQFRSLEDDDTFVWVRAFRNQEERDQQTVAFYGGDTWLQGLSEEALAMLESGEVLLVEPTARSPLR